MHPFLEEFDIPNTGGARFKIELDPFDYNEFRICGEGKGQK